MKPKPESFEKTRDIYLYGRGFMTPFMVDEEFRQLALFIETIEKFIESASAAEITRLEAKVSHLDKDDADEFWQWNYPAHWEEVIGARTRSAFCTQLCSQIESTLAKISEFVKVITRSPITVKDLKGGGTLAQHRKYLEAFGKFENPSSQLWQEVNFIFRLRNIYVHEEGYVGQDKEQGLLDFLTTLPNVKISGGFIELQAGSCSTLLSIAKRFSDSLLEEYSKFKDRVRSIEREME